MRVQSRQGRSSMRWYFALAPARFRTQIALLVAIVAGGCAGGEPAVAADAAGGGSHFNVAVLVNQVPGFRLDCLYAIDSCRLSVLGSVSDGPFILGNNVCTHPRAYSLGVFRYDTAASSGSVLFHAEIFDGNLHKLGEGDTVTTAIRPVSAAINRSAKRSGPPRWHPTLPGAW
jgi:hypothetical protein